MQTQISNIDKIVRILNRETRKFRSPVVTEISKAEKRNPFDVLVSCLLSLRTKDAVTAKAFHRLNKFANTPESLARLSVKKIEQAIYPVGFYRTKARRLKEIAKVLIDDYESKVPDEIDELLKFKGVGRKTANIVVTYGYGKPGIAVDTHVHRISNRLGLVKTKTPEQTEFALRKLLPKKYWIGYNDLLVMWGQNVCVPISPWCSRCRLIRYCRKVEVKRHR